MAQLPDRADIVVVGAGVVGNAAVAHLADHGWRSIVQIDKGQLSDAAACESFHRPGAHTTHTHHHDVALAELFQAARPIEPGDSRKSGVSAVHATSPGSRHPDGKAHDLW